MPGVGAAGGGGGGGSGMGVGGNVGHGYRSPRASVPPPMQVPPPQMQGPAPQFQMPPPAPVAPPAAQSGPGGGGSPYDVFRNNAIDQKPDASYGTSQYVPSLRPGAGHQSFLNQQTNLMNPYSGFANIQNAMHGFRTLGQTRRG